MIINNGVVTGLSMRITEQGIILAGQAVLAREWEILSAGIERTAG
jgi:hypothetical protein